MQCSNLHWRFNFYLFAKCALNPGIRIRHNNADKFLSSIILGTLPYFASSVTFCNVLKNDEHLVPPFQLTKIVTNMVHL
jgi:hypothetical protein